MNSKYGIRENLYNELIELFKKKNIDEVILFGSRARNDYDYNSDIDLAVIFDDDNNDNYIKLFTDLEKLNTLYKFDVIDFDKITNKNLKEEISKDGISIYKK